VTRTIPAQLAVSCSKTPERRAWLERLPGVLGLLESRWGLGIGLPFDREDVTCAWVAPVVLAAGGSAVLKVGMPHMEADHELAGLRFWDGDPTIRVVDADDKLGAMLLERCEPGTPLRTIPEPEQDVVIASMLHRLWRKPPEPHPFRPLYRLIEYWSAETLADRARWPDAGLVREGLRILDELARTASREVLLATDLHAGNVLRAAREPWLAIDPKPFVGDPAYDATQHLINCETRLHGDPEGLIGRMADLMESDRERVRLWMFGRVAAEPRQNWGDDEWMALARRIGP